MLAETITELMRRSEGALDQPLRVRVERDIIVKLDRIEAHLRAKGYRDVSRSELVRAALLGFIDGVTNVDPNVVNEPLERELTRAETRRSPADR